MSHIYFHVGNNLIHIEYNSTVQIINIKHSWQYGKCKLQFDNIYTYLNLAVLILETQIHHNAFKLWQTKKNLDMTRIM